MSLTEARKRSDYELALDHRYVLEPGGKAMPGITTIGSMTDSGAGLQYGAGKLTADIACNEPVPQGLDRFAYQNWLAREFKVRWDAKADLGTRVHAHALSWAQGKEIDQHEDEKPYMDAIAQFCEDEVLGWVALERAGGSRSHGYGFRLDAIARLRSYGTAVQDWKSGRREYSVLKDAIQLTGIANGDGLMAYDDAGMVTGLDPFPVIDSLIDVYLSSDGTYAVYETPFHPSLVSLVWTLADAYHGKKAAEAVLRAKGYKIR